MNDLTNAARQQLANAYRRLAREAERAADIYADPHGGHLLSAPSDPVTGAYEGAGTARRLYDAHQTADRREETG